MLTYGTEGKDHVRDVTGGDDGVSTLKNNHSAKPSSQPSQSSEGEPPRCKAQEETPALATAASAPETNMPQKDYTNWWNRTRKMSKKFTSINLKNEGSVARDHLALERTFLAWLRTSLAFASIGVAVTQLFRLNIGRQNSDSGNDITTTLIMNDASDRIRKLGKPLGTTFLMISIITLLLGFKRYFEGQYWIIQGKFPASRGSIILMTAITFVMMLASLIVILVLEPTNE
ncbi:hypothetical protein Golomagni_00641 [Golovinomyces magnicellulatus]|nr:hypothetical protein Golomagni_00641 [Golovinomyces magnicellulatus]